MSETRVDQTIRRLKNHPLLSWVIVVAVIIGLLITYANSSLELWNKLFAEKKIVYASPKIKNVWIKEGQEIQLASSDLRLRLVDANPTEGQCALQIVGPKNSASRQVAIAQTEIGELVLEGRWVRVGVEEIASTEFLTAPEKTGQASLTVWEQAK